MSLFQFANGYDYHGKKTFLYYLMDGSEIVYVGTTESMDRRIYQHQQSEKKFNHVRYLEVPAHIDRYKAEVDEILAHKPKYNQLAPEADKAGYKSHKAFRLSVEPRPSSNDIKKAFRQGLLTDSFEYSGLIYLKPAEAIDVLSDYFGFDCSEG